MTTEAFAPPQDTDVVQIRDFTIRQKKIKFKIDEDVFEAYAILGLPLLQEIVQTSKKLGAMVEEQNYNAFFEIFDKILYPESAKRFRTRAESIGDDAIDVKRQLLPVLYYLLEEYGVRPTQPSLDSSSGLPSGISGTTSTPGSSLEVLDSTDSVLPVSST